MSETWRDIPESPLYQVSSHGRVRNLETHTILHGGLHKGRIRVVIWAHGRKEYIYVHRLVAEAFLPDYRPGRWVGHYDGNYTNNRADNLHMLRGASERTPRNLQIEIVETGERYPSLSSVARAIGGQNQNVSRVLMGTLRHHKGFTFKYVRA